MSRPTYRPALASRNLSVAYGVLLVGACTASSGWAPWTALVGLAFLGLGLVLGTRLWVSLGFAWFVLAAVVLDLGSGPIEAVLLVVLLAALAWDAGQRSIDVGEQLGREASTGRVELLRAGSSALVGGAATAISYGVYSIAGAYRAFPAVVLLLVLAAGATVWATR